MNSINNIARKEISHSHNHLEPVPIVLIGNKIDLKDRIKVSTSKGKKLAAREMAFEFFETSAKTGENVQLVFERLAYHITDICNPQLMSQYYPNLTIPEEITKAELNDSPPFKLFKFQPVTIEYAENIGQSEESMNSTKGPICNC
ncbi:ras-related protein Rab-3C [Octopus sinensis]|uniref:Ras-related protein Rab-3C n=1 Tax=Octopus sinensis TaxID=2607531 RepID=A0A7E6FB55_9MOLL|nr:ras-related protein Rab-3C [Octopus sinensis]